MFYFVFPDQVKNVSQKSSVLFFFWEDISEEKLPAFSFVASLPHSQNSACVGGYCQALVSQKRMRIMVFGFFQRNRLVIKNWSIWLLECLLEMEQSSY